MKRAALILSFLFVAGVVFWIFPLFHVVRLDQQDNSRRLASFDAEAFATSFWENKLVPSLDQAVDTTLVLARGNATQRGSSVKLGRKIGVSRTTLYLLQGEGKIVSVDQKGVGVAFKLDGGEPDVLLQTGLIFGNAARDATGLLNANDYQNSQEFNEISTELNRIIEGRVIPKLKENASVGRSVKFIGCSEVPDAKRELRPLKVVPLQVTFE